MRTYVCPVCGYVYEQREGDPDHGIAPGTRWEDLPDTWTCPVCGAGKADFLPQEAPEEKNVAGTAQPVAAPAEEAALGSQGFEAMELAALFSNLARGCEKQYKPEEAGLFTQLAGYYGARVAPMTGDFSDLLALTQQDLEAGFPHANAVADANGDRGALRALTWSEKVTRIQQTLLRKGKQPAQSGARDAQVFVCEICGFIYIGDEAPEICPVCKVPRMKITRLQRGE
ncbi:MAG: rubredoxin [Christensenellales bacterium]